MYLSKQKQFTNEFNGSVFGLYKTLVAYRDTFDFPNRYYKALNVLIDLCENEIYHSLPTRNDVELLDEKYYLKTIYKEVL